MDSTAKVKFIMFSPLSEKILIYVTVMRAMVTEVALFVFIVTRMSIGGKFHENVSYKHLALCTDES